MARNQDVSPSVPGPFADEARRRWLQLKDELTTDVAEFNVRQSGAEFSQPSSNQFVVTNSLSGVSLTLTADFNAQMIYYDYAPINKNSAGVPQGGILSIRQSHRGIVDFYSADERLTSEEARKVLLEPVLFPPQLAA